MATRKCGKAAKLPQAASRLPVQHDMVLEAPRGQRWVLVGPSSGWPRPSRKTLYKWAKQRRVSHHGLLIGFFVRVYRTSIKLSQIVAKWRHYCIHQKWSLVQMLVSLVNHQITMFHAQFHNIPRVEVGEAFLCCQATDIFLSSGAAVWQNNAWSMRSSMLNMLLCLHHLALIPSQCPCNHDTEMSWNSLNILTMSSNFQRSKRSFWLQPWPLRLTRKTGCPDCFIANAETWCLPIAKNTPG